MKTIAALFTDAEATGNATRELARAGFSSGAVKILDHHSIAAERRVTIVPGGPAAHGGAATTTGPGNVPAFMSDETTRTELEARGIAGGVLSFFSKGVRDGGRVVAVTTDSDRAHEAADILREAGGKTTSSDDA